MPWTHEPLTVVNGSSVHPEGTVYLKISVGPIIGLVKAAVISNNVLLVILDEDWFRASNTGLVFEPPNPAELHHPALGTVVQAHQKLYPRASCAVILRQFFLAQCTEVPGSLSLQDSPLPEMEPLWKPLCISQPDRATAAPEGMVAVAVHHPDLPSAFIARNLPKMQQVALATVLAANQLTFARDKEDIGHFQGVEHCIDLVPNAMPYSRSPYRYCKDDRKFLHEQTAKMLHKGIIVPATGPWAFPVIVMSRGPKKRLCVNNIPLNKLTLSVVHPLTHADDIMQDAAGASYLHSTKHRTKVRQGQAA